MTTSFRNLQKIIIPQILHLWNRYFAKDSKTYPRDISEKNLVTIPKKTSLQVQRSLLKDHPACRIML